MDLKKEEKKKNVERQALETRRAKSRQRGEPEEESPDEDDGGDGDDDNDDSEGMASRLDRILEGPPQTGVDVPRMGVPKGAPSGSRESQQREPSPRRSHADTPPEPAPGRTVPRPQPPPAFKAGHRVKALTTGLLTRGRAAASSKGGTDHRSTSPSAGQAGDAEPRPSPALEGPGASTRGGSKPAGRGTGRRVALPVGKVSMSWFLFSDAFAFSWAAIFTYAHSSSLRLKRTLEQAQPSMAKRLKVGAASKDSG